MPLGGFALARNDKTGPFSVVGALIERPPSPVPVILSAAKDPFPSPVILSEAKNPSPLRPPSRFGKPAVKASPTRR